MSKKPAEKKTSEEAEHPDEPGRSNAPSGQAQSGSEEREKEKPQSRKRDKIKEAAKSDTFKTLLHSFLGCISGFCCGLCSANMFGGGQGGTNDKDHDDREEHSDEEQHSDDSHHSDNDMDDTSYSDDD